MTAVVSFHRYRLGINAGDVSAAAFLPVVKADAIPGGELGSDDQILGTVKEFKARRQADMDEMRFGDG